MSPKSIDSGFNVAVHEAKGVNLLFEQLAEIKMKI